MIDSYGKPIGGLLFFLGFGLVLSIFIGAYYLYTSIDSFFSLEFTGIAHEYGSLAASVLKNSLIYEIIMISFLFTINLISLYLFFKKRKEFVLFFIISNLFIVFMVFVTELIANMLEPMFYQSTLVVSIQAALWTWYFLKSKRVKDTFVYKRKKLYKVTSEDYELIQKNKEEQTL